MPHLIVDYAPPVAQKIDLDQFCKAMRDALVETAIFPLGGIRVRAHEARAYCIADGSYDLYLDMVLRIGKGRTDDQITKVLDHLYSEAQAFIETGTNNAPFALSLTLQEMDSGRSRKSFNTIHSHIATKS